MGLLLAFVLFRVFDVWKPWPASWVWAIGVQSRNVSVSAARPAVAYPAAIAQVAVRAAVAAAVVATA